MQCPVSENALGTNDHDEAGDNTPDLPDPQSEQVAKQLASLTKQLGDLHGLQVRNLGLVDSLLGLFPEESRERQSADAAFKKYNVNYSRLGSATPNYLKHVLQSIVGDVDAVTSKVLSLNEDKIAHLIEFCKHMRDYTTRRNIPPSSATFSAEQRIVAGGETHELNAEEARIINTASYFGATRTSLFNSRVDVDGKHLVFFDLGSHYFKGLIMSPKHHSKLLHGSNPPPRKRTKTPKSDPRQSPVTVPSRSHTFDLVLQCFAAGEEPTKLYHPLYAGGLPDEISATDVMENMETLFERMDGYQRDPENEEFDKYRVKMPYRFGSPTSRVTMLYSRAFGGIGFSDFFEHVGCRGNLLIRAQDQHGAVMLAFQSAPLFRREKLSDLPVVHSASEVKFVESGGHFVIWIDKDQNQYVASAKNCERVAQLAYDFTPLDEKEPDRYHVVFGLTAFAIAFSKTEQRAMLVQNLATHATNWDCTRDLATSMSEYPQPSDGAVHDLTVWEVHPAEVDNTIAEPMSVFHDLMEQREKLADLIDESTPTLEETLEACLVLQSGDKKSNKSLPLVTSNLKKLDEQQLELTNAVTSLAQRMLRDLTLAHHLSIPASSRVVKIVISSTYNVMTNQETMYSYPFSYFAGAVKKGTKNLPEWMEVSHSDPDEEVFFQQIEETLREKEIILPMDQLKPLIPTLYSKEHISRHDTLSCMEALERAEVIKGDYKSTSAYRDADKMCAHLDELKRETRIITVDITQRGFSANVVDFILEHMRLIRMYRYGLIRKPDEIDDYNNVRGSGDRAVKANELTSALKDLRIKSCQF